jgi:hypothetical protein
LGNPPEKQKVRRSKIISTKNVPKFYYGIIAME